MKQITVTREVQTVTDGDKSAGGKIGTAAAYIIAALMAAIVIGGLLWVAEAIWRAVL